MRTRAWKYTALLLTGGVLLQLGSCAGALLQLAGQQLLSTLVGALLSGVISSTGGTTP